MSSTPNVSARFAKNRFRNTKELIIEIILFLPLLFQLRQPLVLFGFLSLSLFIFLSMYHL